MKNKLYHLKEKIRNPFFKKWAADVNVYLKDTPWLMSDTKSLIFHLVPYKWNQFGTTGLSVHEFFVYFMTFTFINRY